MQSRARACLLLRGGEVWDGSAFEPADVLINDDQIVEVGQPLSAARGDIEEIDCAKLLVLPGWCNAHTHSNNALVRSIVDVASLESMINVGPAAYSGRTAEETYLGAALNAIEMAHTGCTSCCDSFTTLPSPSIDDVEAVVRAYSDVGMRVTIGLQYTDLLLHESLPGLLAELPPDVAKEIRSQTPKPVDMSVLREAVERWNGANGGRIHIALAPTIPQLCSDRLLEESVAMAHELGVMLHTHLAESRVETSTSLSRFGLSIVEYLSEIGFLSPRTLLAHGVWLSDRDIEVIASAGAVIAHAPGSNLRLGCGIARVTDMLRAGITVGIGTDGSLTSDNQNMFETMRFAAVASRIRSYDERDWLSTRNVLGLATEATSAILGIPDAVGAVKPGHKADLVVVDSGSIYLRPRNDLVTQLVLAETGSGVRFVIIDGDLVVREGRVVRVDEEAVLGAADEASRSIRTRNESMWNVVNQVAPYVRRASLDIAESMPWTMHFSRKQSIQDQSRPAITEQSPRGRKNEIE